MLTWSEYLNWLEYFRDRHHEADLQRARARGEIRTDDPKAVQSLLAASGAAARKNPRSTRKDAAPKTIKGPAHG